MRALVFDFSIPKYALAKALGRYVPGLHYGPGACFSLRDGVPEPAPPSREFARLAPRLAGVCGSDLAMIFFKWSPALSAYASTPAVAGHEILADVVAPCEGSTLKEGDRVVVDPWLSCAVRGAEPCTRCAIGEYATCERAGTGPRKGVMIGASRELPGGFGERMVAHASQMFRVPDGVSDARAAMCEPLSVAVHAVLRQQPVGGERVLVIGGGIIGLATVWALRELHPSVHVTLLALEEHQLAAGQALGAARCVRPERGADVVETLGHDLGTTVLRPLIGRPFLAGGFDHVYDCVGSQRSLEDALRVTRAGGTVVLLGAPGVVPKLDWSFVWTKEIRIVGTYAYAYDEFGSTRRRTFEITLELMTTSRAPLESLVTHTFAMSDYAKAIEANVDRRAHRSIKTLIDPRR